MPLFESIVLLWDGEPHSAAVNMAMDEVILKESSVPVLRFYRWKNPAASFGYFEKYAAVAGSHGARELVRRWTGGGVVLHGGDTTYSLMVPAGFPFLKLGAAQSYLAIHKQTSEAMRESGVAVSMASTAAPKVSQACFENAVRHDVMLEGRKIAGAAQRRSKFGLLHQGSIQCAHLPEDFGERLARGLAGTVERETVAQSRIEAAGILAVNKYTTEGWIRKF